MSSFYRNKPVEEVSARDRNDFDLFSTLKYRLKIRIRKWMITWRDLFQYFSDIFGKHAVKNKVFFEQVHPDGPIKRQLITVKTLYQNE